MNGDYLGILLHSLYFYILFEFYIMIMLYYLRIRKKTQIHVHCRDTGKNYKPPDDFFSSLNRFLKVEL